MTDGNISATSLIDRISGGGGQGKDLRGAQKGAGKTGPRILMVDDNATVIKTFMACDKSYAASNPALPCQMTFFRIGDGDRALTRDALTLIKAGPRFDAIYVDGDLGALGDGVNLIRQIRSLPGLKYQPAAIYTAQADYIARQAKAHDGPRIIAKFDHSNDRVIQAMVIDIRNLAADARDRFWYDARKTVAEMLDNGESVEEAAGAFGKMLQQDYGVESWYLREWEPTGLCAIAMEDRFGVGDCLAIAAVPGYQTNLLLGQTSDPWIRIDSIPADQSKNLEKAVDHRVIGARLGSRMAGDATATFTAYRPPSAPAFDDADAHGLHHVAVLLRLALGKLKTAKRLKDLSDVITAVQKMEKSNLICSRIADFMHRQIQAPLEQTDMQAKTTVRLFLRGTASLNRFGDNDREDEGKLDGRNELAIGLYDDCVIARTIEAGKPKTSNQEDEKNKNFKKTTDSQIKSYLTVPLRHDGAILGVLNLESTGAGCYDDDRDVPLAESVAELAAAAIMDLRTNRFMIELADLGAQTFAVNPDLAAFQAKAANALYELTGYSEMLVFDAPKTHGAAWELRQIWQGAEKKVQALVADRIASVADIIRQGWADTFLKKSLDDDSHKDGVYHGEGEEGHPDTAHGDLRPNGPPTRHNIAILLGDKGEHQRAIMLIFVRPNPLPARLDEPLAKFARLYDGAYLASQRGKDLKEAKRKADYEEELSQQLSDQRHLVGSYLGLAKNVVDGALLYNTVDIDAFKEVGKRIDVAAEVLGATPLVHNPAPELLDLGAIWDDLVDDHGGVGDAPLNYGKGDRVRVMGDPVMIRAILFHLLFNTREHAAPNGATQVVFQPRRNGCAICDDGPEIDPATQAKMFDRGQSSKGMGGGNGLFNARRYARLNGGTLDYEREGGMNCFVLTLPGGSDDEQ